MHCTDYLIIGKEKGWNHVQWFSKVLQTDRSYETDHNNVQNPMLNGWICGIDMLGQDNEKTSIHCRGSIEYISDEIMPCTESDDMAKFTLTTDTAWAMLESYSIFFLENMM